MSLLAQRASIRSPKVATESTKPPPILRANEPVASSPARNPFKDKGREPFHQHFNLCGLVRAEARPIGLIVFEELRHLVEPVSHRLGSRPKDGFFPGLLDRKHRG